MVRSSARTRVGTSEGGWEAEAARVAYGRSTLRIGIAPDKPQRAPGELFEHGFAHVAAVNERLGAKLFESLNRSGYTPAASVGI